MLLSRKRQRSAHIIMLIFQYGSNTSDKRLNAHDRLDGAAVVVGLAQTVSKYQLAFTYRSRTNQCGVADLIPDQAAGRPILGVLYDIPETRVFRQVSQRLKTLDQIEGEGTAYKRVEICILLPDGQEVEVATYVVLSPEPNHATSEKYVRYIMQGLHARGAPVEYLEYVAERASESCPELTAQFHALVTRLTASESAPNSR